VSGSGSDVLRGAMDRPRVTYTPRSDATPEGELNRLANVYRFILDCHAKKMAAEPALAPDSRNDAAIVRYTKEVSHVEQRHDRSSQIT
jgi:hypothetical protein